MARTFRLRITCHSDQQNIVHLATDAIQSLLPKNKVNLTNRISNCHDIVVYSNSLPIMFPQHGVGRKHQRSIKLQNWQNFVITDEPKGLILGLLHSDGCFYINHVGSYQYPAFQFTNKSEGIVDIYCNALKSMLVPYTISKRKNGTLDVLVRNKKGVDILKSFWQSK